MSCEPRAPVAEVDADDDVAQPPRPGALRQRRQVDVRFGVRVVPGDEPGQHAGVRRQRVGADQREVDAGLGLLREAAQDLDVAVAAADEQQPHGGHPATTLNPSIIPPSSCSRLWQWNM